MGMKGVNMGIKGTPGYKEIHMGIHGCPRV